MWLSSTRLAGPGEYNALPASGNISTNSPAACLAASLPALSRPGCRAERDMPPRRPADPHARPPGTIPTKFQNTESVGNIRVLSVQ